ncbi:MAG TPA: hypothetical protein VM925_02255 [Labilithrix sp.]|nr:hypothetical protein [Labilithrix sp.]
MAVPLALPRPVRRRTLSFDFIDAIGGAVDRADARVPFARRKGSQAAGTPADGPSFADVTVELDDPQRPSEVPTVPSPAFDSAAAADSSANPIELSASVLQSEPELFVSMSSTAALRRRTLALDLDEIDEPRKVSRAVSEPPRAYELLRRVGGRARHVALGLLFSHGLVAVVVALLVRSEDRSTMLGGGPHVALVERSPLVDPGAIEIPPPAAGGCATSGASRLLASRAQIGAGLDVSVLGTGFGVAFASAPTEAIGLRVEGSSMRIAETVRSKAPLVVSRAVVDPASEDDDALAVRIDQADARTITPGGDRPAFRLVARGGAISALLDDEHGLRVRHVWPLPGARALGEAAAASVPSVPEVVRAASRDDGGIVIALRRPSAFWLGFADGWLAPVAPLATLSRPGLTVGTPAVVASGSGGVVTWAERASSGYDWSVAVAAFEPDGEGQVVVGPAHVIGNGMSPTLAVLPDGELLLAYAHGPPGAHRIVARRLARDLEPRGETVVVSPESINAGQPAVAVRPDGRAIVAFLAAEGGRTASVVATPLACFPAR